MSEHNSAAQVGPSLLLDEPRLDVGRRALVLGGGGSAGNAWEIGVIAGLAEAGVDVTAAELIVGTSAGATAAAQVTGATPSSLFAAVLEVQLPTARPGASETGRRPGWVADHLERLHRIIAASVDAADMRHRVGAAALALETAPDGQAGRPWRAIVAARLPSQLWPDRTVLITAVDALTGKPVVFDRHSGVDLADAVAASTSASLPHRIGDNRYIDGGYRRNENADLAVGCGRVLVLSPFSGRSLHPPAWGMDLAAQVEELRAGGSRVQTIFPDARALQAFGDNIMDLSTRPPSARAGHQHGRTLAERLIEFWR